MKTVWEQSHKGSNPFPSARKTDLFRQVGFSVIFALRRVLLLRSVIWAYAQVLLPFGQLYGEYNTTFAEGKNTTMPQGIISLCAQHRISPTSCPDRY